MSQTILLLGAVAAAAGAAPNTASAAPMASGSNREFQHDVTTTASPAAVWAVWMDVPGWGRWDLGLKSARSDAPLAKGVSGSIVPRSGSTANFVVRDFVAGKSYTFETSLPLAKLSVRRSIVATSPTRFRHEVRFSGWLAGFWAWQLGPSFREALPPTMRKLAVIAEASGK